MPKKTKTSSKRNAAARSSLARGSAFLRVNYGINRRKGRGIEHANGKMRIKGAWGDDATHDKIRRIISRRHPGWLVTGWCLASPNIVDVGRAGNGAPSSIQPPSNP